MAAKTGAIVTSFKRRLVSGTPTPEDQQRLVLAKAIMQARAEGVSMRSLARTLGIVEATLVSFASRGICTAAIEYIKERETSSDDKIRAAREVEERDEVDSLAPFAISFLRDAFRKEEKVNKAGEKASDWVDPGLAMWATEQLIKGKGWNAPRGAGQTIVNINIQTKDRVLGAVLDDEEKMALARALPSPEALDGEYEEMEEV
jgi:hypothetical protein